MTIGNIRAAFGGLARDLGPRLAHAVPRIHGKRDSDWGYALVAVVAPLAGGVAGAWLDGAIGS